MLKLARYLAAVFVTSGGTFAISIGVATGSIRTHSRRVLAAE